MTGAPEDWFAVRCIFRANRVEGAFEERVTLWRAGSLDHAIHQAEVEATEYAGRVDSRYLDMAQAYRLADPPGHAAEVFSLIRDSALSPEAYLDRFFDTGTERQQLTPP